MRSDVSDILSENKRRKEVANTYFNPIVGIGCGDERFELILNDLPEQISTMWLPVIMRNIPMIKHLQKVRSVEAFLKSMGEENTIENREVVMRALTRMRSRYDFFYWAASLVYIKAKGGGENVTLWCNRPQRRVVRFLEERRLKGLPIRVVLLKARQWGGSTLIQLYMAWLQLTQETGLNSLIVGHIKTVSDEVKDMFDRMMEEYPLWMLHKMGEGYDVKEKKIKGVGLSGSIHEVPQRKCKIKVGTAEAPDSARGGDYNLVHCTEVGLWKTTEGKQPSDIVRSACSGVLLRPHTMIVYESTANGTGNFFHQEYLAAKAGTSQFEAIFVAWYEIENYVAPIEDEEAFAQWLYDGRNNDIVGTDREEPGSYLWWLWKQGATLESIQWYITERSKYSSHGDMASEYPSDDIEAFKHSGENVFDQYLVEKLRKSCKTPAMIGEIVGDAEEGKAALRGLHFVNDGHGFLYVWNLPEKDGEEEMVANRYLVVVDIGGRSKSADWSVIAVIDRLFMIDGGKPLIVATWRGHVDMDILAWKAAKTAKFYNNALLVIESNTLETKDRERFVDGEQAPFILNQIAEVYDNMYARKQSEEEIREKAPVRYGFHTNIKTKPMVISTLVKVVREGLYIERDDRCIDELIVYERKQNGSYGAMIGYHDDLLMTRAIGLHICFYEMPMPAIVKRGRFKPINRTVKSEATIG